MKTIRIFGFIAFAVTTLLATQEITAQEVQQENSQIIMKKTEWFPVCQDVLEVLRQPENEGYLQSSERFSCSVHEMSHEQYIACLKDENRKQAFYAALSKVPVELVFPERYKKFSLPKWQDVPEGEARILFPKVFEVAERERKTRESRTSQPDNFEMSVKKASVDVDNSGSKEDLYLISTRSKIHGSMISNPYLHMSEIDGTQIAEDFNTTPAHDQVFYYEGRTFYLNRGVFASLAVLEPVRSGRWFAQPYICEYEVRSITGERKQPWQHSDGTK